jgi:hypothetical protein
MSERSIAEPERTRGEQLLDKCAAIHHQAIALAFTIFAAPRTTS